MKTKEELQSVQMTPINSARAAASSSSSDSESDHEHSEENSTYSAELQTQGIDDHRKEEERLTEAEKNERLKKQLMVSLAGEVRRVEQKQRSDPKSAGPLCLTLCFIHQRN